MAGWDGKTRERIGLERDDDGRLSGGVDRHWRGWRGGGEVNSEGGRGLRW